MSDRYKEGYQKAYKKGMTIKQLKKLLEDWPDEDCKGNPTMLCIGKDDTGIGHQVTSMSRCNGNWVGNDPFDDKPGYLADGLLHLYYKYP